LYCFHSNKWYIQKGHDIGTLLTNAQAVARDFYSGRETTNTTAQWEEDRANVRSSAEEAKRLIEEWDRQAELKAEQEHNHA
ncbi:MAG: hypothetical protein IJR44_06315, partial [Neisseriaceae bacterium]|nr:hypothetical protein [Neisseriaceae bacterium]